MLYMILIMKLRAQTSGWSSWTNCSASEKCSQKRILSCNDGVGLACLNETNGAFEQRALNCNASPECLENVDEMFGASEVSAFGN